MKTKNVIYLGMLIAVAVLMTSCEKFIEQEQRGVQNLDNYFVTVEECEVFVNDLYRRSLEHFTWNQLLAGRLANETATDDAWMGNTGQDASSFIPAAQYLIAPNRMGYLETVFKIRYENVAACNIAIQGISGSSINDDAKNRLLGEVLFLRAYNYYDLVNNFGGVPLVVEPLSTNNMDKTNATKEEVYAQIETDLREAVSLLPQTLDPATVGRANKWAAHALMARVSLFESKWQQAFDHADTVISSGLYRLEPDFLDVSSVHNPNGVESILEVQSNSTSDRVLGNMLSTFTGARGERKEGFPSNDAGDVMDGWGWCVPTSDLENVYLSEDDEIRRRSTITKYGEPAYGDEELNPTHIFALEHNKSGRVIRKFYIPVAVRRQLVNKQQNAPLNTSVLRLSEMYLTRAEAAFQLGNVGQAMDDVDIVRDRVNLTPKKGTVSGNQALYAIWKERRMEFAFEGLRLFDIRRQIDPATNKTVIEGLMGPLGSFVKYNTETSQDEYELANKLERQDKGTFFDASKHLLWPITQSEIDRSNGRIQQTPGY